MINSGVAIRPEEHKDYKSIVSLILRSFREGTDYSDGTDIIALVEEIRDSRYYIPELSFVAELDGEIVGHFLFSHFPLSATEKGGHGDGVRGLYAGGGDGKARSGYAALWSAEAGGLARSAHRASPVGGGAASQRKPRGHDVQPGRLSNQPQMELKEITFETDLPEEASFSGDLKWTAEAVENIVKNCLNLRERKQSLQKKQEYWRQSRQELPR